MGDMADFANDYQDSTMDEYYGYFDGTVDIPYGEQIPQLCKEFELPISYEAVSSFLERVDTLGISQAYPTNLTTTSESPTTKKVVLNGKAIDNLKKDSPTCNFCEEGMASRIGKFGKFYYCTNHCEGQKTVSESYWLSIKKAAGISVNVGSSNLLGNTPSTSTCEGDNTPDPLRFRSHYHFMDIGDMVIKLPKSFHAKTLKWFYNFKVGEELRDHYMEGDYYQFSRPDENSYLIVKFDYVCKQEVGREVVTKDFLVQSIVDSVEE